MNRNTTSHHVVSAAIGGLVVGLVLVSFQTFAQEENNVPRIFSYTGSLDEDGIPADGDFDMTFSIFDSSQGGELLWTEIWEGDAVVSVSRGKFTVPLGLLNNSDNDDNNDLADVISAAQALYIGVEVNGVLLAGRQRLTPMPYAMLTNNVHGDFSVSNVLHVKSGVDINGIGLENLGPFRVGETGGRLLSIDGNELQARNAASDDFQTTLHLQPYGGRVELGESVSDTDNVNLEVHGEVKANSLRVTGNISSDDSDMLSISDAEGVNIAGRLRIEELSLAVTRRETNGCTELIDAHDEDGVVKGFCFLTEVRIERLNVEDADSEDEDDVEGDCDLSIKENGKWQICDDSSTYLNMECEVACIELF